MYFHIIPYEICDLFVTVRIKIKSLINGIPHAFGCAVFWLNKTPPAIKTDGVFSCLYLHKTVTAFFGGRWSSVDV